MTPARVLRSVAGTGSIRFFGDFLLQVRFRRKSSLLSKAAVKGREGVKASRFGIIVNAFGRILAVIPLRQDMDVCETWAMMTGIASANS